MEQEIQPQPQQSNSFPTNNGTFSKPLAILRGCALLLIYTTIFFFLFFYGHSNEGLGFIRNVFSVEFPGYYFYFFVCLAISVWMAKSSSFNKQLVKIGGILIGLDILSLLIPAGFTSLGIVLFPALICTLFLFAVAALIYSASKTLSDRFKLSIVLAIIVFLVLCPVVYATYNDLSVRQKIIYKNNSMFDTIQECNAYFYSVRENDCKKDWTAMHDRWDLEAVKQDSNLVYGQTVDANSGNYNFFPKENIKDIVVGTGEVAKIDNTAIINVQSANIRGKTYSNLISIKSRQADPGIFENKVMQMYNTYVTTADEYSYSLGIIGMKVGGIREITFKSGTDFWFNGVKPAILIKANEPVTYRIELLSLVKGLNYYQENLTP